MILTRYLYVKQLVEASLQEAILKREYEQSVFWAYELYFSGFEQEVLDNLEIIYETIFKENHPKLGLYISKKSRELKDKPELIATIVKNLTMKRADIKETPGVKFVNVKPHHIIPFMTKEPEGPNWKFLKEVCLFGVLASSLDEISADEWRQNWILHASGSPIWSKRVIEYGGKMIDNNILFDNEEEFHDRYNYEPDEQPAEIRKNCIGV
jgi:hypothetical protein